MNILDYIDWRGDLPFAADGVNEVDNLIFSTLAYLDMEKPVSADGGAPTIAALFRRFAEAGCERSSKPSDPLPLLEKAAQSARFRDVTAAWYVNEVDAERQLQFAAVTFLLPDGTAYVAFRGTDNSIAGWREDCNLSFLSETPGQNEAVRYLERVAAQTRGDLIVGGHSKGGNFAVYAAAFCAESVREDRIVRVYSNDGPGFNDAVAASPEYLSILDKTVKIIPDSSLVGILLSSREARKVVKCDAKGGIQQHNPYSWCVRGAAFEAADERATASIFMDDVLTRWVATLSDENLQILVNAVFDSLEASGAATLSEISEHKRACCTAILKAAAKIDPANRSDIAGSLKKLLVSGKDAVMAETRRGAGQKKTLPADG